MNNKLFFCLLNKHRKIEEIPFSEILYLEGNINYTLIHLQNGKVKLSPRTFLFHINHSLNESFVRIHRSFCVNRNHIHAYDKKENSNYLLLNGGIQLAVSRRKKKDLVKM